MSASELDDWLQGKQSQSSGWIKPDTVDNETIGHERFLLIAHFRWCFSDDDDEADWLVKSGRKIVSILQKNPDKVPEKYDREDIQHMRRVVAYCKRHLAQEGATKNNTNSKSYKSLKNWGHDPLKA